MIDRSIISGNFPKIVCLCGSTKHPERFIEANRQETMADKIVLSVGVFKHSTEAIHGHAINLTDEEVDRLNEIHFRKIDLADEILFLWSILASSPVAKPRKKLSTPKRTVRRFDGGLAPIRPNNTPLGHYTESLILEQQGFHATIDITPLPASGRSEFSRQTYV